MNLLILAAVAAAAAPSETDLRCYRLMAELAQAEQPAARALGLGAASWFLGRIDAAAPGYDVARLPGVPRRERPALARRCAALLEAGGYDPGRQAPEAAAPTS